MKTMLFDHSLMKTIFKIIFLKMGSFVFIFPFSILVSRSLGADGYGVYGVVTATSALLVVLCTLGNDQLIVKEISSNGIENKHNKKIVFTSIKCSIFIVSAVVFLLFCLYVTYNDIIYILICLVFPFMVFAKYSISILRGVQKTLLSSVSGNFVQPFICFMMVCGLYFLDYINIIVVIVSVSFSFICSFLFSMYWERQSYLSIWDFKKSINVSSLIRLSYPFLGLTLTNSLITYSDRIMISYIHSYDQAGIYLIAARNASIMMICFGCAQYVLAPRVAKIQEKSKIYLQNIANMHVLLLTFLGAFFYLFLVLFSSYITLIFGSDFSGSKDVMLVLIFFYYTYFFFGSPIMYLFMTGNQNVGFKIILTSLFINIILNIILITQYGSMGAAVATGITMLYQSIVGSIYLFKETGVRSDFINAISNIINKYILK